MALIGKDGPAVVLGARACAWLEQYARLSELRVQVRGTDRDISTQLEEIRYAAMSWRSSATGTTEATKPELPAKSEQWLSTGKAADLLNMTARGVLKAIHEDRLQATQVAGRWRVTREAVEHYLAARAA